MLKKKIIPLLLVLVLLISLVQPASAASVTGDVAPYGVMDLTVVNPDIEALPDRYRLTYTLDGQTDNFYWCTRYNSSSDLYTTYDLDVNYIATREGYVAESSDDRYSLCYIYPNGRSFVDFSPITSFTNTDLSVTFTFDYRVYCYSSTSSKVGYHELSPYDTTVYCDYLFYDEDFNFLESSSVRMIRDTYTVGDASGSWGTAVYSCSSLTFPDGTAYFVPRFLFRSVCYYRGATSSTSYSYYNTQISPNVSSTLRFDVMDYDGDCTVDGIWTFNDMISYPTSLFQEVEFYCDDFYESITYSAAENDYSTSSLVYCDRYGNFERVYADSWPLASKATIDFGNEPQTVSAEFYAFLTANATRISDSSTTSKGGTVTIKDYSGSSTLATVDVDAYPCVVTVTETGLEFRASSSDEEAFATYEYSGSGEFVGASSVPSASGTSFTVGTSFSLFGDGIIYVHAEGDTGDSGSDTGTVYIYDSSGNVICDYFTGVEFPCTVTVTETGLELTHSGSSGTFAYTYTGTGEFLGASSVPDASTVLFPIGTSFTLYGGANVYIQDTASNSGSSGDSSGSGSGDAGGSDSIDTTDPTTDPLENEKNQASSGGNDNVNDLLDVIPDYSDGFVTALEDFADAFSYEGTACVLTIPGITIPAVSDLIPEFELLPTSVYNVESLFSLFPENIVLLVQSLLTIALIGYCFKELYDTVSYFLTLRKGDG